MRPDPRAAYRVQLHPGFGFDEAAEIVPYLAELGISHLYASPYLQAVAGSSHGYDVADPTRVNDELGGARAHARMRKALETHGLGQVVDVVPNHMAIAGRQNPWWWDVLENGPSSRYATYFDVDWAASEERWPNKVLLPVLSDHYGRVLESGQLRLSREEGVFAIHYCEHVFPADPSSVADLIARAADACGSEFLGFLADSYARLPRPTVTARQAVERRHRDKVVLADLLARLCREDAKVAAAVGGEVARVNSDRDALDSLIEGQNYRLALWRTAGRDLGYRRFFDIKDLIGLRVEDEEVFRSTHALPVAWLQEGSAHGIRVDHPDGLRDPAEYFHRLRAACPDAWIVAEKILTPGEDLPPDWPVEGTTGYDFLNLAGGLFVDPRGETPLTDVYRDFTGESVDFDALALECKRFVVKEILGSELNRLSALFVDVCERHRRHRDYTRHELHEALCETAACFPVYRTYVRAAERVASESDERYVSQAVQTAVAQRADLDPRLFAFLKDLLLLRVPGSLEGELAMRFQQLTGPAMAKGIEDTALFRFNRLACLNEVGGDPRRFGVEVAEFHRVCSQAQSRRPLSMLASSTHDTKRSADVRARLALLSEIPDRWADAVRRWAARNERRRRGDAPSRNAEYLFYQTLVGAWPIDAPRMTLYMEKAVREAKVDTSWTRRSDAYERGVREFAAGALADAEFVADVEEFVAPLVLPGRINSLSQTLLKLAAPGVPDLYQGSELWDLSLVDPDNRRPVDFALRARLQKEIETLSPEEIMARIDEGLPKLYLISRTLRLRREAHALFGPDGTYRALAAHGAQADRVVAFVRGERIAAAVPRLVLGLGGNWGDTALELPEGRWRNVLTQDELTGGHVPMDRILSRFPVALLAREE